MILAMTAHGITLDSLSIWAAIGLVCGILAAMIWSGRRLVILDIAIGIVASCCGGYASMLALGNSNTYQFELATLSALFFAIASLVLFAWLISRSRPHR